MPSVKGVLKSSAGQIADWGGLKQRSRTAFRLVIIRYAFMLPFGMIIVFISFNRSDFSVVSMRAKSYSNLIVHSVCPQSPHLGKRRHVFQMVCWDWAIPSQCCKCVMQTPLMVGKVFYSLPNYGTVIL